MWINQIKSRLLDSLTLPCSSVCVRPGCLSDWLKAVEEPAEGRDSHPGPGGSGKTRTPWWPGIHRTPGKQRQTTM